MKSAIAVLAALSGLALACLSASLPPTSDCSEFNGVDLLPALAFLGLYMVAGLYATLKGAATERLILVMGTALMMAGYFTMLSWTWPLAVEAEISRARHCSEVEPARAAP